MMIQEDNELVTRSIRAKDILKTPATVYEATQKKIIFQCWSVTSPELEEQNNEVN